jgi:cell division protein ZipA
MDKELLRIVIIATGLMITIGMLTWSYLRNKKSQEGMDFYDDRVIPRQWTMRK